MSETSQPVAVRLRGVEAHAGKARLFGPIDLEIAAGEHVLIVGPSGSGKSSILRTISGLAAPSAGRVELFGQTVSDGRRLVVQPEARGIGFLFQGGALWPHMDAAGNLEFVLRARGLSKSDAKGRVASLLERVELSGYEQRMPGTLSGGEAQRLALARALAVEPRLLLLDEPLGPLDAELRGSMLERLATLQRELDLTILHVTHDPEEASLSKDGPATRTVAIRDGLIESPSNADRGSH